MNNNPPVFKRAHPGELARFNPDTKICTMNCSQHKDDPRTIVERKLMCEDCEVIKPISRQRMVLYRYTENPTDKDMDLLHQESERQQRVYAIGALKRIAAGTETDPVAFAELSLKHILGPDWKNNVGL